MEKDNDLVVFDTYENPIDASIVKGVLETNGVPCMLSNEVLSSVLPLSGTSIGDVRLLVFRKDYDEAKKIMHSAPIE